MQIRAVNLGHLLPSISAGFVHPYMVMNVDGRQLQNGWWIPVYIMATKGTTMSISQHIQTRPSHAALWHLCTRCHPASPRSPHRTLAWRQDLIGATWTGANHWGLGGSAPKMYVCVSMRQTVLTEWLR